MSVVDPTGFVYLDIIYYALIVCGGPALLVDLLLYPDPFGSNCTMPTASRAWRFAD